METQAIATPRCPAGLEPMDWLRGKLKNTWRNGNPNRDQREGQAKSELVYMDWNVEEC